MKFLLEGPGGLPGAKQARTIETDLPFTVGSTLHVTGNLTVDGILSAGSEATTAQVITAASANAFTVGPNGTTSPALNVDTSQANAVTGLNIQSNSSGNAVYVSAISSNANENLDFDAKGSGVIKFNFVNSNAAFNIQVKSSSANAFFIGAAGSSNTPAFIVDASVGSQASGLKVTGAATGGTVALSCVDSGSNTNISLNGKGSGTVILGGTSTGLVSIGRGAVKPPTLSATIAALGTTQNSTPTAAQLRGGVVTQTGATGAGTVTLDNGTNISAQVPGVTVGDSFQCIFANLGGGQTLTITGATGATVVGIGAVPTGLNAIMTFVNTGANAWNVYCQISA